MEPGTPQRSPIGSSVASDSPVRSRSTTMTQSVFGSEAPLRRPDRQAYVTDADDDDDDDDDDVNNNNNNNNHNNNTSPTIFDEEAGQRSSSPDSNDSTRGKLWKWIPTPFWKAGRSAVRWINGPVPPRHYTIKPIFPAVQEYPLRLAFRLLPKDHHRKLAAILLWTLWLVVFAVVKHQEDNKAEIQGWGVPQDISCGATYWASGNTCGIDGLDCRPFNGSGVAFRCPAFCDGYLVLNPRAVGSREVVYAPLVIGGPPDGDDNIHPNTTVYRADSHICNAAIHAGVVSRTYGGCGVVRLVGTHANFAASRRHGISSVPFDSYFPSSFVFDEPVECGALDNRWALLALSVVVTSLLSFFSFSPTWFFWPTFVILFWQTGMASDPPPRLSTADLVSTVLSRFIPAMFVAWALLDRMGVRDTLAGLTAQVEKTVLWLGGAWVSSLDNYTWSKVIPIQRLNAHDLQQQPGAKAALVVIIVILVLAVVWQAWCFRNEGRLIGRIRLYAFILLAILLSLALPGLDLRIHHYIIGLVLIPGTAIQTRVSLLAQGLLLGWFVNGVARWGFASVLQTPADLQGDAQIGSALPSILEPVVSWVNATATTVAAAAAMSSTATSSSITFRWSDVPAAGTYDGISILVNDVERFRGYFSDGIDSWAWNRPYDHGDVVLDADLDLPEYFRFAYMSGTSTQDYTQAGTWTARGEWIHMASGPSRTRRSVVERVLGSI